MSSKMSSFTGYMLNICVIVLIISETIYCLRKVSLIAKGLKYIPKDRIPMDTEELFLTRNRLHNITSEDFKGMFALKILGLAFNKMTIFPNLSSVGEILETLFIANNLIVEVPAAHLDMLKQLQSLNLESNLLVTLPDSSGPSDTLTSLKLSFNKLRSFPEMNTLLKSVEKLQMAGNFIKEIHTSRFTGMDNLKQFDLSSNDLQYFPDMEPLKYSLLVLKLFNNSLTLVKSELVLTLESLQKLDLGDNLLHTLSEIGHGISLSISGNPLVCNMNLAWLVDRDTDATCHLPITLKGRKLSSLIPEDLETGILTFEM